ncbi:MAG: ATPase, T2SS/T4P/T4SS family [Myxococcota bacterium]
MNLRLTGYHARFLEPEALRAFLRGEGATPGRHFLSRFDAGRWAEAVLATSDTGTLPDEAACALADAVLRAGEAGGFVDVEGVDADEVARTVGALFARLLHDDAAGERLLTGGLLDRLGVGRFALGSLPLRVLAQRLEPSALKEERHAAKAGWVSELLNTLESALLVSQRTPEAHLILVPEWAPQAPAADDERPASTVDDESPESEPLDVVGLLRHAQALHASDLLFVPGAPPLAQGPFGRRALRPAPLTAEDARRLAYAFLTDSHVERFERLGALVVGFGVRDLGRYRLSLTRERALVAATLRLLPPRPPALKELPLPARFVAALDNLERGLVVIGGPPGSGRSTTLASLSQALLDGGAVLASVEEPLAWPLRASAGLARQVDVVEDARAVDALRALRTAPLDVLALDLADDDAACESALDAAADGKLVLLALRGATASALVHRLVAADAKLQRRRLSESLAAVLCQTRVPTEAGDGWTVECEALIPSEALRRHLRALDTMPPAAVLEPEEA